MIHPVWPGKRCVAAFGIALLVFAQPVLAGRIEAVLFTAGPSATAASTVFKTGLIDFIKRATSTIDVAIFTLSDADVIAALNAAATAGRTVRLVGDGDEASKTVGLSPLISTRYSPSSFNHTHHKFVVIDAASDSAAAVWTGSANFTVTGLGGSAPGNPGGQHNNAVIIQDKNLAAAYKAEFERLFVSGLFHQQKGVTVSSFTMDDGTVIEVRFSPNTGNGSTSTGIINTINSAVTSVYYAIFTFGTQTIANPIIARHSAGVANFGWFDANQANDPAFTQFDELAAAGASVQKHSGTSLMHHKYLVKDAKVVVTGSANFSEQANSDNDENQIIIANSFIAELYIKELNRISGQNLLNLGPNNLNDTVISPSTTSTTTTTTSTTTTASPGGKITTGPNPFRLGQGSVTFRSANAGSIRQIEILDLSGRHIRTIYPTTNPQAITWDGRNNQTSLVSSGMYFFRAESGGQVFTGRFTVVR